MKRHGVVERRVNVDMAYACHLCPSVFEDPVIFTRHQTIAHVAAPWPQAITDAVPEMAYEVARLADGRFTCVSCPYASGRYDHIASHVLEMHQRAFACRECGSRFETVNAMREHRATAHHALKFACQTCDKSFLLYAVYLAHRCTGRVDRAYASKHQEFWCLEPGCMVLCRSQQQLKLHMRLTGHAGGEAFVCGVCGHRTPYYARAAKHAASACSPSILKKA